MSLRSKYRAAIELDSTNMKQTAGDPQGCGLIETFLIEVYRCTVCKTCFTQRSAILVHVELHHAKENTQDGLHEDHQSVANKTPAADAFHSTSLSVEHEGSQIEKDGSKDCPSPISNALKVLVGLGTEGTSLLIEEVDQGNTEQTGSGVQACSLDAPGARESTVVYNLSGVSIPNEALAATGTSNNREDNCKTDHGSAVRMSGQSIVGNDLLNMDRKRMSSTIVHGIGENMEVILEAPRITKTSPVQRHTLDKSQNTNLDTLNDLVTTTETLLRLPRSNLSVPVVIPRSVSHGQQDTLDIDRLVRSASESNPDASLITVVTQSKDAEHSEMLQFKKGWKTNAMIPTAKSLGIVSPFPKRERNCRKKFSCPTCSAKYYTQKLLKNHINKKHVRVNKFLCEICGLALATKLGVKNHVIAKHSNMAFYQCDICDYRTKHKKHFQNHATKHSGGIVCQVCDMTFTSLAKLKQHRESSAHLNKMNPLACQQCDYTTNKMDNLRVHMRKHNDQRPYKCMQCEYASRDASTLKKHVMAKHSKIRPHRCHHCEFSSVDRVGLTIHLRKHSGERPFRCSLCNFTAKRRATLNNHLQTHDTPSGLQATSGSRSTTVHVIPDPP